jgi:hypothetical protein
MKARMAVLCAALCLVGVTMCFAENPNMGTWKLNEAKSKLSPGGAKNTMVMYEAAGDSIKVTVEGVDNDGKPTHNEWTGKFNGKAYPITGDPTADMRSYRQVNARTLVFTNTMGGKATLTGRIVVSANGKVRTVTTHATDSKGTKVTVIAVYDKQ